jgi:hypothetical protein
MMEIQFQRGCYTQNIDSIKLIDSVKLSIIATDSVSCT